MLAAHEATQNVHTLTVVIALAVGTLAVFWRATLKIMIALLAVAIISLLIFGAIAILQSMQSTGK